MENLHEIYTNRVIQIFPLLSYSSAAIVLHCFKNLNFGLVLELSFVLLLVLRLRPLDHYCPSLQSTIELRPQLFVFALLFKKVIDVSMEQPISWLYCRQASRFARVIFFGDSSMLPVLHCSVERESSPSKADHPDR